MHTTDAEVFGCCSYLVTFLMSIAWIGVLSYFMVEWAARIGCILDVPSVLMGVTVLAAGKLNLYLIFYRN